MKIDLIRDKIDIEDEGEVRSVNSLPGRQLALTAQLHKEVNAIAKDGVNVEAYGDLYDLMLEMMRINEVEISKMEECRLERLEQLGGFRKGLIWIRDVPVRSVDIPGYPEGTLTSS